MVFEKQYDFATERLERWLVDLSDVIDQKWLVRCLRGAAKKFVEIVLQTDRAASLKGLYMVKDGVDAPTTAGNKIGTNVPLAQTTQSGTISPATIPTQEDNNPLKEKIKKLKEDVEFYKKEYEKAVKNSDKADIEKGELNIEIQELREKYRDIKYKKASSDTSREALAKQAVKFITLNMDVPISIVYETFKETNKFRTWMLEYEQVLEYLNPEIEAVEYQKLCAVFKKLFNHIKYETSPEPIAMLTGELWEIAAQMHQPRVE